MISIFHQRAVRKNVKRFNIMFLNRIVTGVYYYTKHTKSVRFAEPSPASKLSTYRPPTISFLKSSQEDYAPLDSPTGSVGSC